MNVLKFELFVPIDSREEIQTNVSPIILKKKKKNQHLFIYYYVIERKVSSITSINYYISLCGFFFKNKICKVEFSQPCVGFILCQICF